MKYTLINKFTGKLFRYACTIFPDTTFPINEDVLKYVAITEELENIVENNVENRNIELKEVQHNKIVSKILNNKNIDFKKILESKINPKSEQNFELDKIDGLYSKS